MNFWIEKDLPPVELFRKFIHFGGVTVPNWFDNVIIQFFYSQGKKLLQLLMNCQTGEDRASEWGFQK